LLAAIWWYVIPPLQTIYPWIIFWSVLSQEGFRILFFWLYAKAERGFLRPNQTTKLTTHPDNFLVALSFGLGSGLTHSGVSYISILFDATGPGSFYLPTCPGVSVFILSALHSLAFVILHQAWAIISFEGWKATESKVTKKSGAFKIILVFILHLASSYMTMVNNTNCIGAIIALYITLIISVIIAWRLSATSPLLISKTAIHKFNELQED